MRLMIVGGGTGGHITPGIAIARSLLEKNQNAQVLFVGSKKGLEVDLVPKAGFPIATIPAVPLTRKISPQLFSTGYHSLKGVMASMGLIRRFKPQIILGTGGFVCGPFLLAAILLRIPFLLQEQNVIPGLTNRLFSPFARKVALGFEEAARHFPGKGEKLIYTGNPIYPHLLTVSRLEGAQRLGIDAQKKVLLIYGGSRGANSINQAALAAYPHLVTHSDLFILHICGPGNQEGILDGIAKLGLSQHPRLTIYEYVYDMAAFLAVADLVVARAGAVGLSEILALGIPSILVPYPYAADNHQYENARVVEKAKGGIVIPDGELEGSLLAQQIVTLLNDASLLQEYAFHARQLGAIDATERILELLFNELERESIP